MKAVLWDGNKQIQGSIKITPLALVFEFSDFAETDLILEILYKDIGSISYCKVYGILNNGLEITSKIGKKNVFVVEDSVGFKKDVESRLV